MITRTIVSGPLAGDYSLGYDAENRLVSVSGPSGFAVSFAYNGDGQRVQSTIAGVTTTFAGNYYEVAGGMATKYYYAGSARIAMRTSSSLYYLLGDHLGSTSLTTDSAGNVVSELRYDAWGETRFANGTTPTSYRYTGQREESSFGLYFYQARWYDPYITHWAQPDTIVPDPLNPQAWDRYSYANYSPLRYTDPSGHRPCDDQLGCDDLIFRSPKRPIWSTAQYKNETIGKLLRDLSTRLQHAANFFSDLGAMSEIGFTSAGLFGGGAAVGWIDLGFPIADVSGGLAGGLVGWEVGHGLHTIITNPIESGISNLSALSTYGSDLAYGNTRLDIYDTNATVVVGQPTATSAALAFIGGANSVGIVDAAIDQVGSWYADGKIGGVYDLFGITGKAFQPFMFGPHFNIQFGDE